MAFSLQLCPEGCAYCLWLRVDLSTKTQSQVKVESRVLRFQVQVKSQVIFFFYQIQSWVGVVQLAAVQIESRAHEVTMPLV